MLPKTHIIFGAIFSLLLGFIFPEKVGVLGGIIIFISSVLIDFDHYTYFVYREKDLSLKKAVRWYYKNIDKFNKMSKKEKDKIYTGLCFMHGIEALLILVLLIFAFPMFSSFFSFILIGFIFHECLDWIDLYRRKYRYDKVISFFYSIAKAKNKKLLQDI